VVYARIVGFSGDPGTPLELNNGGSVRSSKQLRKFMPSSSNPLGYDPSSGHYRYLSEYKLNVPEQLGKPKRAPAKGKSAVLKSVAKKGASKPSNQGSPRLPKSAETGPANLSEQPTVTKKGTKREAPGMVNSGPTGVSPARTLAPAVDAVAESGRKRVRTAAGATASVPPPIPAGAGTRTTRSRTPN
jgi:hypothetical protein